MVSDRVGMTLNFDKVDIFLINSWKQRVKQFFTNCINIKWIKFKQNITKSDSVYGWAYLNNGRYLLFIIIY